MSSRQRSRLAAASLVVGSLALAAGLSIQSAAAIPMPPSGPFVPPTPPETSEPSPTVWPPTGPASGSSAILVADTWVASYAPSANYSSATTLRSGPASTGQGQALLRVAVPSRPSDKYLRDAYLRMNSTAGRVCPKEVSIGRITSAWNPATVSWQTMPTSVGTKPRPAYPSVEAGSLVEEACGDTSGPEVFDITYIVSSWLSGVANHGLVLSSSTSRTYTSQEGGSSAATVIMNWGQYPSTPADLTISAPGAPDALTSLTPHFDAKVSSPEGVAVGGQFQIEKSTGEVIWSTLTTRSTSGRTVGVDVPTSVLQPGQTYVMRVWASDRWGARSTAPAVLTFSTAAAPTPPPTPPTPPSSTDPVIQQILGLSPGATEADVVAQVNAVIADSAQDGGVPWTFDKAKQIVLYYQQQVANSQASESSARPTAASSCGWAVAPQGNALQVTRDGVVDTLFANSSGSDATSMVFYGSVGGEPATAMVWMGASQRSLAASLAQGAGNSKDLARASLEGAVDGEGPGEVAQTFSMAPAPGDLEPVAYKLTVGDKLEAGVPSVGRPEAVAQAVPSADCVRWYAATDAGTEVKTPSGTFLVPGAESATGSPSAAYPSTTGAFRYRTFIPDATASTGILCGRFQGDDRGFTSYYHASNRTRASVFFNWPTKTIDVTKHVGATHRLKSVESTMGLDRGFQAATKTASSAGILFHTATMSPTYGSININHSVANPLCGPAGPITYNVVIEMWKDGSARLSGTAGKVPNHEAYVYPTSASNGPEIYTRKRSSFNCLNLPCGNVTIRRTLP